MYRIFLVGVAGFAGTLARYWLSGWADERLGMTFPIGTLVVNLVGCLAVGFLFMLQRRGFSSIRSFEPPFSWVFSAALRRFHRSVSRRSRCCATVKCFWLH